MTVLKADRKTIPIERYNKEEYVYEVADGRLHLQRPQKKL